MATPTTPESQAMLVAQFIEAMKPIWPNLTKRQTKMEFINLRQARSKARFLSKMVGVKSPPLHKRNNENGQ